MDARVLLRIEDHDRQRSRPEYERSIREDLAWLGLEPAESVRQSERSALYDQAFDILSDTGLVYACDCSRKQIESAASTEGELRYPGTCRERGLAAGEGRGLRIGVHAGDERFDDLLLGPQSQTPADQCGDMLLRDRHGLWTYQFCAAVDDLAQEITHVVRGDDLLHSTGRQMLLARLLGREAPAVFLHHPLIMKSPSQKVSKSDADSGIRELRDAGWSPVRVLGFTAALAGLIDAPCDLEVAELASLIVSR